MRVSVVLPVYNRARYVGEAIDSVLGQTLAPDELIVVDDGSTDESVAVVERFARPGVRILRREKNGGIGAARNTGLAAVRGDLVAFIDSDDVWQRDKLALQVAVLEEANDVQLVFGHLVEFLSPERADELAGTLRVAREPIPGLIATTLLARRTAVAQIGPFDEGLRVGEFVEWMARAHDLHLASRMLPEVVARRRIHGGNSVLTRANTDYLRAIKSTLDRRRRAAHAG